MTVNNNTNQNYSPPVITNNQALPSQSPPPEPLKDMSQAVHESGIHHLGQIPPFPDLSIAPYSDLNFINSTIDEQNTSNYQLIGNHFFMQTQIGNQIGFEIYKLRNTVNGDSTLNNKNQINEKNLEAQKSKSKSNESKKKASVASEPLVSQALPNAKKFDLHVINDQEFVIKIEHKNGDKKIQWWVLTGEALAEKQGVKLTDWDGHFLSVTPEHVQFSAKVPLATVDQPSTLLKTYPVNNPTSMNMEKRLIPHFINQSKDSLSYEGNLILHLEAAGQNQMMIIRDETLVLKDLKPIVLLNSLGNRLTRIPLETSNHRLHFYNVPKQTLEDTDYQVGNHKHSDGNHTIFTTPNQTLVFIKGENLIRTPLLKDGDVYQPVGIQWVKVTTSNVLIGLKDDIDVFDFDGIFRQTIKKPKGFSKSTVDHGIIFFQLNKKGKTTFSYGNPQTFEAEIKPIPKVKIGKIAKAKDHKYSEDFISIIKDVGQHSLVISNQKKSILTLRRIRFITENNNNKLY